MLDRDRFVGALTVVSVLYFLAGTLGLSFAPDNANVSAVWPPAGIAVAALLVLGLRAWPAVAIGAFLTNLGASHEIVPSVAIAAGNTLECVAAAMLATRVARGRLAFERGPDVFRFACRRSARAAHRGHRRHGDVASIGYVAPHGRVENLAHLVARRCNRYRAVCADGRAVDERQAAARGGRRNR